MKLSFNSESNLTTQEEKDLNEIVAIDNKVKELQIEITKLLKSVEQKRKNLRKKKVFI